MLQAAAAKEGQSIPTAVDGVSAGESIFWNQVLACDPAERLTASELLQHPFLDEGS